MRGEDQRSEGSFSYVPLERRISADHPLRAIRTPTDEALAGLSRNFNKLYARDGRPSIPPERLLRALLLQAQQFEKTAKARRQRLGIEQPEQPRERIMARQAILQPQEFSKKPLPVLGEIGKLDAALTAANRRHQRHRQNLQQIVPRRVARPRIRNLTQNREQHSHRELSG